MRRLVTAIAKVMVATALSTVVGAALADDITTSVSGFGTVGGTFTSDANYAYVHNFKEFSGASNSFDVGLESRIGLQAVVRFDSQWSVTAQEVAKLRGSSNYDPGTEWLFVQYQPESDLKLRLGRVVLPVFLLSDTINVGYAAPWFRAPNEVYDSNFFDYLDGAQALWQHPLGPLQLNLEATYGQGNALVESSGLQLAINSKSMFNAAASLSWRDLLVRFAETDISASTSLQLPGIQPLSLHVDDRFHCLGLQYDNGKALIMSEWAKRQQNDLPAFNKPLIDSTNWYAAAGWRFGKFTPLAMYSTVNVTSSLFAAPASYHTWQATLRYDVVRNVDLKLQISRAQAGNQSYWVVSNPASNEHVNVYSFGADFVF
jgi:hypothetical protein